MKHLAIILLLAARAFAAEVTLAWDPNPEPDIAGYELSYGVEPGKHTVTTPTTATQHTLTDMTEGTTYFFVVRAKNQAGQLSPPSTEIIYTIPKPSPNGWVVKFVDDEQADGYGAELAIDGDPATFWHTVWREGLPQTPMPHEIQIDMGAAKPVSGFTYLPRQDEFEGSNVKGFEFYTSLDGVTWGDPAASGELAQGKQLSTVPFPSRSARYFRLVVTSSQNGGQGASIAELSVIESGPPVPPSAPKGLRITITVHPN